VSEPVATGGYEQYEATLSSAADTRAARDTVDRLRTAVHPLGAKVGGNTAVNLDTQRAAAHDNKVIIPVVLAVVSLILVLLSFAASLGVCGIVFTHLFGFEGADSGFPLEIFIFLVALGVDYNIFLELAATFAGLATLPVTGMVEMAFAVAFGVLLDSLLIRSLVVPALTYDIGRRVWWPGRLAGDRTFEAGERPMPQAVR
jgi:putative drug exporter of the RND superfamily